MMKVLKLTIKKKWFDMIASGEKKEEYREIKPYWKIRLLDKMLISTEELKKIVPGTNLTNAEIWRRLYDAIEFRNGYSKNAPILLVECKGIDIGPAKPEWSGNWQGDVFRIKLGNIIKKPE